MKLDEICARLDALLAGRQGAAERVEARQRCGSLNNNFASTPHLFVFDSFGKEKTAPIQRIMSAPMMKGEEVMGVVQICRKGADADPSVRKFTEPELGALCALADVLARHL